MTCGIGWYHTEHGTCPGVWPQPLPMTKKQAIDKIVTEYRLSRDAARRAVTYAGRNGVFNSMNFKIEHVTRNDYNIVHKPQR